MDWVIGVIGTLHMFENDLTQVTLLVLAGYLAIQIVYYFIVRHFYLRQIKQAIEQACV